MTSPIAAELLDPFSPADGLQGGCAMASFGGQHGQPGRGAVKFCKDCKFGAKELDWKCQHPDAAQRELDLVTGEDRINRNFCHYERQIGKCGPGAKNWQPIETSGGFV